MWEACFEESLKKRKKYFSYLFIFVFMKNQIYSFLFLSFVFMKNQI